MSTQPTTEVVARPIDLLKKAINSDSVQEQFRNALGKHKDTFVASLIDMYTGDKSLQTCKPNAVISEALRAATMSLPLNKALGFSYIVVYNNKVKVTNERGQIVEKTIPTPTFITGYKGFIQLAMRTGQYRCINCDVVYDGELSNVDKLSGRITMDGEKKSDKVVGYFAYIELINGFSKVLFLSVEDVARHAKTYSPSLKYNKNVTVDSLKQLGENRTFASSVGWLGNFESMALKTVLRKLLSKYGYLSIEMQQVIDAEDKADAKAIRDMENNDPVIDVEMEDVTNQKELQGAAPDAPDSKCPY